MASPSEPPPGSHAYMASLVPPSKQEFQRIARVQEQKEAEARCRLEEQKRKLVQQQKKRASMATAFGDEQASAARKIQRTFRGYRSRRELKGLSLDANTRWITAIREAQFREYARSNAKGTSKITPNEVADGEEQASPAKQSWKRAAIVARRAGLDDRVPSSSTSSSEDAPNGSSQLRKAQKKRPKEARMMGLKYFLEMVDLKHRHGSNLRKYHEVWKKSDTKENFFHWLDYGEGRNIDLESCPRDKLDRDQVRYLSREERQYYVVTADSEGRLCWAKNGARIDTTERFKDSIHGIVPSDDPTPAYVPRDDHSFYGTGSESSSISSSLSSVDKISSAGKDGEDGADPARVVKKAKYVSPSYILRKLLGKPVKKNKWIFVADTSFRLYVGIKNSGVFQHSSFLQGSRIAAAGLIKIKNGRLASLSPLSGHYRPPASNFHSFVRSLRQAGVDMSHVSMSKSYALLIGLESYMKTKQKSKHLVEGAARRRDKILAPDEVRRQDEAARDTSQSAEKERQFLQKQMEEEEAMREENQIGAKVMQKLGAIAREPKGQKGDEGSDP